MPSPESALRLITPRPFGFSIGSSRCTKRSGGRYAEEVFRIRAIQLRDVHLKPGPQQRPQGADRGRSAARLQGRHPRGDSLAEALAGPWFEVADRPTAALLHLTAIGGIHRPSGGSGHPRAAARLLLRRALPHLGRSQDARRTEQRHRRPDLEARLAASRTAVRDTAGRTSRKRSHRIWHQHVIESWPPFVRAIARAN